MSATDILKEGGYIMVNKEIAKEYGVNTALMLGELCAEYDYWAQRGMIDDEGWFYSTIDNVEQSTGLGKTAQTTALHILQENNYLKTSYRGMPRKRYIRLSGFATRQQASTEQANKGACNTLASEYGARQQVGVEQAINNNNSNNNINNNKAIGLTPSNNKYDAKHIAKVFGC